MNDEIKGILDDLDYAKQRNRGTITLNIKDIKIILDYITNLQQIEQDHKETNATLMSELAKLEEENERLKELNAELKAITKRPTPIDYAMIQKRYDDYKSRCEKAIDKLTIKQARFINEKGYVLDDNDLDEIMYILQNGSDSQ